MEGLPGRVVPVLQPDGHQLARREPASSIRTVGLCHSVQGTAIELSRDLGIPYEEIRYRAAGINHMAFYLKFEREAEDLYPGSARTRRRHRSRTMVRYECSRGSATSSPSSEHFAEYTPYFIKRDVPT